MPKSVRTNERNNRGLLSKEIRLTDVISSSVWTTNPVKSKSNATVQCYCIFLYFNSELGWTGIVYILLIFTVKNDTCQCGKSLGESRFFVKQGLAVESYYGVTCGRNIQNILWGDQTGDPNLTWVSFLWTGQNHILAFNLILFTVGLYYGKPFWLLIFLRVWTFDINFLNFYIFDIQFLGEIIILDIKNRISTNISFFLISVNKFLLVKTWILDINNDLI